MIDRWVPPEPMAAREAQQYVGLTVEGATQRADRNKHEIRVIDDDSWVEEEGVTRALTADLRFRRVNVVVRGGVITQIDGIG